MRKTARAARGFGAALLATTIGFGGAWLGAPGQALAQPLSLSSEDPAAQAAVRRARDWQIRKAQEAGVVPRIATARYDLDGDGLAEIIGVLQAPDRCAAMGLRNCPLIILHQPAPGRFLEVGSFFGDAVQVLDSRSQGWLDLETRFTQGPWRRTTWNGLLYRLRR
ncbi:hypothetical protein [Pseudoroseomonas cervicalis]|uniref:hypothetical protein n=1 Tax=Teichococcus cervicalis TaxID=204525 RepID=UPI0022F17A36|nr:hypothetical protein [Pseudoroseomonas cervicalis]WBV45319.1 hypothetical protein PFY06_20865 [Pseudoroseomonas cervicalis]